MVMDKNINVQTVLAPLLLVIVFIAVLGAMANQTASLTTESNALNESLNPIVQNVSFSLANGNLSSVVELRNDVGVIVGSDNFTINLADGIINVTNGDTTTMFIDYDFRGDDFINQTAPRVIIGLIILVIVIIFLVRLTRREDRTSTR